MEITYDRKKSKKAVDEDIEKQCRDIMQEFRLFTNNYHVLFLIHRNKEGGDTNNSKIRKIIVRNNGEYKTELINLLTEKHESELPLRIYASLNERNFDKAIRQFKYEQLDADYFDQVQKENFYLDLKNRFIGCLMQPPQRKTSYFLFYVDNEDGRDVMGEALTALPPEQIVQTYSTKNGWHIITKPFDYTKCVLPKNCEFKKDALLLLAY